MKKLIGIAILTSIASAQAAPAPAKRVEAQQQSMASAQSDASAEPRKSIGLDLHAGLSLARLHGDSQGVTIDNKVGISAGIGYELPITRAFSFHPEVNYVQKGFSTVVKDQPLFDGSKGDATTSLVLDYVELPLLLVAQLPDLSFRPRLMAGPYVGTLVSKKAKSEATTRQGLKQATEIDLDSNELRGLDYGFQFGAGADFKVSDSNSLLADFRYELGLADIAKAADSVVKNRVMILTLGFRL